MDIVLLQDVKSLGKNGEIVNVNDGYARNYIIPKKLGIPATAKNLNDLKLQKANAEKVAADQLEAAKKFAEDLKEKSITLSVKAGEGGKVFGSVSTKEIAKGASEQLGIDLDKKKMLLSVPIKTCGTHVVPIRVHKDVVAELKVIVVEAK